MGLLSRQHEYSVQRQWDHTRHIMAAMGAGKGRPKKVMKLPLIDGGPAQNAPKDLNHAREIANNLMKYLPVKK